MNRNQTLTYAIIVNYNSSKETIALFYNLKQQNYDNLKILVIDNFSSKCDQDQLINKIPSGNLYLNKKNSGYAGGNNIGIEIAIKENANYVWLLNPDIRIGETALPILLRTIKKDSTLAAVGPRIIHREKREYIFSDGEKISFEDCSTQHKNFNLRTSEVLPNVDYDIDYIDGSSILLNIETLKRIGNLSEEYFLYFEETDWCFRAKKNNWKLAVNSNAVVYNLTSPKEAIFHYYMSRNRLVFAKKFHPNFKKIRLLLIAQIWKEIESRFRGKFFKPFFRSRLKGLISGLLKTF
ncbi:glycosyltransferase family 2 protein [Salegentibacter agarivorans]